MNRRAMAAIAAAAVQLALCGCATFKGSRRLDMTPFAENTTTMVGEFLKYSRPPTFVYLREYRNHPSVEAAREAAKPLQALMRGVALYSMQISALADSRLPEKAQARELARYLAEVVRPGVAAGHASQIGITVEELDKIIGEISAKDTLLDAIAAAQPLVNAVILSAHRHFELVSSRSEEAKATLGALIEEKFSSLTRNLRDLERIQMQTVRSFALVAQIRLREPGALEALLEEDPDLRHVLPAGKQPGPGDLDAAEKRLTGQLQRLKAARDQLAPEHALYMEHRRELEALGARVEEELIWGRSTLGLWARSHKNLGAGVPVPPAVDVLNLIRGASGAVKKVVP